MASRHPNNEWIRPSVIHCRQPIRCVSLFLMGALTSALRCAFPDEGFYVPRGNILTPEPVESPFNYGQLLVGASVPRLVLWDTDGKLFDLHAAFSKKPTIMIFFRGAW